MLLSPFPAPQFFPLPLSFPASSFLFLLSDSTDEFSGLEMFYLSYILPDTLLRVIRSYSSNSAGLDNIIRRLLNLCFPVIFPIVLDLFNVLFSSFTFPSSWKLSHVLPLPKNNNSSSLLNYRPNFLTLLGKAARANRLQ